MKISTLEDSNLFAEIGKMDEKISDNLVKQLEKLQIKCASLKQDLQVNFSIFKVFGRKLNDFKQDQDLQFNLLASTPGTCSGKQDQILL